MKLMVLDFKVFLITHKPWEFFGCHCHLGGLYLQRLLFVFVLVLQPSGNAIANRPATAFVMEARASVTCAQFSILCISSINLALAWSGVMTDGRCVGYVLFDFGFLFLYI